MRGLKSGRPSAVTLSREPPPARLSPRARAMQANLCVEITQRASLKHSTRLLTAWEAKIFQTLQLHREPVEESNKTQHATRLPLERNTGVTPLFA
jgi:hypothetical protein